MSESFFDFKDPKSESVPKADPQSLNSELDWVIKFLPEVNSQFMLDDISRPEEDTLGNSARLQFIKDETHRLLESSPITEHAKKYILSIFERAYLEARQGISSEEVQEVLDALKDSVENNSGGVFGNDASSFDMFLLQNSIYYYVQEAKDFRRGLESGRIDPSQSSPSDFELLSQRFAIGESNQEWQEEYQSHWPVA